MWRVACCLTVCADTAGFKNQYGQTCHDYEKAKYCENGSAGPGWKNAWGALPREIEAACCACGKETYVPAAKATPTQQSYVAGI